MTGIAQTPDEQARTKKLLTLDVPSYRQAYSDRTAWVMACLSELAYIKFNPLLPRGVQAERLARVFENLVGAGTKKALLLLADKFAYDHEKERERLDSELGNLNFQLHETFDADGTQAILMSNKKCVVLAFRGTEATSPQDIKADLKAKATLCESGGKIHSGFNDAFNSVFLVVQNAINRDGFRELPLFITGHSLGGALATIAAKKLSHAGGIAACYTFGAPRVGDAEWISGIKPPLYRMVNAADCVTMLPPGDEIMTVIGWLLRFIAWLNIPFVSQPIERFRQWLAKWFASYIHGGNMRYLTDCQKGNYEDVMLLYSVSLFRRIKGWLIKERPWKKFLADHSISVYRKKLMVVAEQRNPEQK